MTAADAGARTGKVLLLDPIDASVADPKVLSHESCPCHARLPLRAASRSNAEQRFASAIDLGARRTQIAQIRLADASADWQLCRIFPGPVVRCRDCCLGGGHTVASNSGL